MTHRQRPSTTQKPTVAMQDAALDNNNDNSTTATTTADAQDIAKRIFVRLDPVLGMLLQLIQQYQAVVGRERTTASSQQERILPLLQTLSGVLDRLLQALQSLSRDYTDDQVSRSLVLLWDYLSLPLLAVLRGTLKGKEHWPLLSATAQQQRQIRTSAAFKCMQRAAQTLTATVKLVHKKQNHALSTSVILSALVPTVTALPSGREIASASATAADQSLDSGDDCCAAILESVATLVLPNGTFMNAPFAREIAGAMGGALVARVVDSCVTIVTPPEQPLLLLADKGSTKLLSQALVTIESMMQAMPLVSVWKGVFPGCFAGLYRRLLHSLRIGKPALSGVVVECLRILSLFLHQTLQLPKTETVVVAADSVVVELRSLVLSANTSLTLECECNDDSVTTGTGTPLAYQAAGTDFVAQARQRLPAPLMVLVNLLTTARSPAVRRQATSFFQTILRDTRACLADASDDLMQATMEACLVFSRDPDNDTAALAQAVLSAYLNASESGQDINELVLPRILAMMEELPILAQCLKETELRTKQTLLSAYLSINSMSKAASKKLRSSLVSEPVLTTVRTALSRMLDVHFESVEPRAAKSIVVTNSSNNNNDTRRRPQEPPLRHMSNETKSFAVEMIHALGKALGPKHTAVFVDACIAELFEALVGRVESRVSLVGKSETEWLHEWIGSIILVRELLVGAFAKGSDAQSTKKVRKRLGILSDLASSILPIIISSPLYDLPTCSSHDAAKVPIETVDLRQGKDLVANTNRREGSRVVSSAALRGNASLTFHLLGLTNTIFDLLGSAVHCFLPVVLYPILENIGLRSVSMNQEMAIFVLETLATHCEYGNVTDLLTRNMDHLLGTLMGRIRVPGGHSLGKTDLDDGTVTVVSTVTAMLRLATVSIQNQQRCMQSDGGPSILSYMQELVTALTGRFDRQAAKSMDSQDTVTVFVQLFDAALNYLYCWYDTSTVSIKYPVGSELPTKPWLALLDPFRAEEGKALTPETGFKLLRDENREATNPPPGTTGRMITVNETIFVEYLMSRCCFLLSHSSLSVQVQSCDALIHGFEFLGLVAKRYCPNPDEPNGPSNAILRQVSKSWPTISTRLKATSSSVHVSKGTSLLVAIPSLSQPRVPFPANLGHQRVFLSRVFELVAVMTECADDFMATRFRHDVWPCMGQVLENYATCRQNSLRNERPSSSSSLLAARTSRSGARNRHYPKTSDSERNLIVAAIHCLSRVYQHRPAGLALGGLIPSTGVILFPFLNDDDTIESLCMAALKNMILIDCDALFRLLLEMSGRGLPLCPFGALENTTWKDEGFKGARLAPSQASSNKLTQRANELIKFIESLPEQPLE